MHSHYEKIYFSIIKETKNSTINNYLYLDKGFTFTDTDLLFDIDVKEKVDQLKENYKFIKYRIRYDNYSRFFNQEDIKKENDHIYTSKILNHDLQNKVIQISYPIDLEFYDGESDTIIHLNNKIFSIFYHDRVSNRFDLKNNPNIEYTKENSNIVHYIEDTNSIVVNYIDGYYDFLDLIRNHSIKYYKVYKEEYKDVLVYNNRIIGQLSENDHILSLNNSLEPIITINGKEFNLTHGLNYILKEPEEFLYYPTIDKLIGSVSFNEYEKNDILYIKDTNEILVVSDNNYKIVPVDFKNIYYSFDYIEDDSVTVGSILIDKKLGTLSIYNGSIWVNMNKPSLQLLSNIINSDRLFDKENLHEYSLELYGYNKNEEFVLLDMTIRKNITLDVEFPIENNIIESVFVNGKEVYNYTEANYGIHFTSPLVKEDKLEIILSNTNNYDWVSGYVVDHETIALAHPLEITYVKKLIINNKEYNVDYVDQNKVKIRHTSTKELLVLDSCDRIYAKVKTSTEYSKAYPVFSLEYKDNLIEIDLPFEIRNNRFDHIMVTNNGEEVLINPKIIIQEDRLYAYYDINNPTKLKFSRYINKEDIIKIQYVNHKDCKYNPETFFDNLQTDYDIQNQIITDNIISFEDDLISLPHLYDEILNENNDEDIVDNNINIGSLPEIPTNKESNSEKVNKLISQYALKSNPDLSLHASLNKPNPVKDNRPIMARPSSFKVKPIVTKKRKRSAAYNKYNFEFTKNFMEKREELKNYMYNINNHMVETYMGLRKARDALRSMINYICNILCLEEILKGMMHIFDGILKAIEALMSMNIAELMKKLKNLLGNIVDKIKKAITGIVGSLKEIIGNVIGSINKIYEGIKTAVKKAIETVTNVVNGIIKTLSKIKNVLSLLFRKFDITIIGKFIGSFISKVFKSAIGAIGVFLNLISKSIDSILHLFTGFKTGLGSLSDNLFNFHANFKKFTSSLTLEGIVDFICNKILGNLLHIVDGLLDILNHLQKRYQDFLNKLFADNYRSKINQFDRLITAGDFFKSHIRICDILRDMFATNDFTLAGFIKRVTNLDKTFRIWKKNKQILKNIANSDHYGGGHEINDLASAGNQITNAVLTLDEIFGMNEVMIERIISNLTRAFVPNFKKTVGSVVDTQAMSKQVFDPVRFKHLYKKITLH